MFARPAIRSAIGNSNAACFLRTAAARRSVAVSRVNPSVVGIFSSPTTTIATRAFSLSAIRKEAASDSTLLNVLQAEIKHESEKNEQGEVVPDFLKDFKAKDVFTIGDCEGANEVTLTREFGSEKIAVTFSIDDVANMEAAEEAQDEVTFPVSVVVTVTKPSAPKAGALTFQTVVEGGNFQLTNVTYSADATLASTDTAEADYKRRGEYVGPIVEGLDQTLSSALYEYLGARGVNDELADFIPAYIEYKEQREYERWLSKLHEFVKTK